MRRRGRAPASLAVAVLLASCSVVSTETPDPAAIPSSSLAAIDREATGSVIELGSSNAEGIGWRYSVYPAGDEWCTQLELANGASSVCGDLLPPEAAAFGPVSVTDVGPDERQVIDGVVSAETFTVWLIENDSQRRFPATLMPLDPAGLDGVAFLGIAPEEMTVTHIQAMARSGEVLETYELP
jgi:hypothetical protein